MAVRRITDLLTKNDFMKFEKPCPEFPYFGATYPDACCIDGFLWDLDSDDSDAGGLTQGGEIPCPFCNTESFIEIHLDDHPESENDRDSLLEKIENTYRQYT